ncbi:intein splicing region [Neisseria sp. oral taxon 020 str. F0370]|uniref:alpha/beta fold hydrolase n=1 Tax=Neisseria sp. oral taxon 020 TaxID=712401 RepID=UPI0002A36590|nr:alpha/beta fold hydrolase [Neisseria sp. oral taxon 020]EKY03043.1 intein splicing region [Neisseria sp. oral taxon 020 str. F0370]
MQATHTHPNKTPDTPSETHSGSLKPRYRLTKIGEQMARLPIDPKVARILLAAKKHDCMAEILVIASALSIQDPRERPLEARDAAAKAHERFTDKQSDFLAYLNIWDSFQRERDKGLSNKQLVQWCRQYFLSHLRMREWRELHHQLAQTAIEMGLTTKEAAFRRPPEVRQLTSSENAGDQDLSAKLKQKQLDKKQHRAQIRAAKEAGYEQIHRALLTGLIANVGMKSPDGNDYTGARGSRFHLFPASALFKAKPKWVMAAELVETTKLYARDVAAIQPEWIEQEAPHLVRYHYFEPHWEQKRGEVIASERVTLYGLTVLPRRPVSYGRIAPEEAREIFIRSALVAQECDLKADFFVHNKKLIKEITELEHKSRKQDVLVDDEALFAFYHERLPDFYTADAVSDGLHTESSLHPRRLPENQHACFPAGTLVHTDKGPVPIEHIRVGDHVLSRSEYGGTDAPTAYKTVLRAFCSGESTLVRLMLCSDNQDSKHPSPVYQALMTANHPLWDTVLQKWRPAAELEKGTLLACANGNTLRVLSLEHFEKSTTDTVIYNHRLTVSGTEIAYYSVGNTAGRPILLLHGGGVDSALLSWQEVMQKWQDDDYYLIAPDWPGYGASEKPNVNYSIDYYEQFLNQLITSLNLSNPILCGLSMGGAVALQYALHHPQQVEKLVLLAPWGISRSAPLSGIGKWYAKSRLNRLSYRLCASRWLTRYLIATTLIGDPQRITPETVDSVRAAALDKDAGKAFQSFQINEIGDSQQIGRLLPQLPSLSMPVLLVHGENDPGVPLSDAQAAASSIPNSRLEVFGQHKHWAQKESPQRFADLLRDFCCHEQPSSAVSRVPVYNLEVEDFHTYFIGEQAIWVHNCDMQIQPEKILSDDPKPKKQPAPQKGRLKPLPLADIRTFAAWLKTAERDNPRLLFLTRDDLMQHAAAHITEEQFPKFWQTADGKFKLSYRFEPHHPLDGVTLTLPLTVLNRISPASLEWLVPGMIREKIQLQIKALPKQIRRICVPVPEFITQFLSQNPDRNAPILPQLAQAIAKTAGDIRILEQINQEEWAAFRLPEHCYFNLRIIDDGGQELAMGRDLIQIQQQLGKAAATTFRDNTQEFERDNVTAWDIGTLPESIKFARGKQQLTGYLGLQKEKDGRIALRLFDTFAAAEQAHRLGVIELMKLQLKEQVKDLNKGIQGFTQAAMLLKHINADTLRDDLTQAVCDRAFIGEDELPRNEKAFKEQIKRARSRLPAVKEALSRYLQETAAAYAELNGKLGKHPLTHLIRQRLQTLLAAGFATRTPWAQWPRLPTYLKAMTLRLEKYSGNPARDAAREADIQELEQMWQEKTDGLVKQGLPISDDLAAFKWMIEELRVSLFAQELKTPYPVSVKRLLKEWEGLK